MDGKQPTRRELGQRRISLATRALAVAAAVATAAFAAAAAAHGKGSSSGSSASNSSNLSFQSDDDSGAVTPSQLDPQPSFASPVAGSGGS